MNNVAKLVIILFAIFLMLCIAPWLLIWSTNTLVAASMVGAPAGAFVPFIEFGFWTWLAGFVLILILAGSRK